MASIEYFTSFSKEGEKETTKQIWTIMVVGISVSFSDDTKEDGRIGKSHSHKWREKGSVMTLSLLSHDKSCIIIINLRRGERDAIKNISLQMEKRCQMFICSSWKKRYFWNLSPEWQSACLDSPFLSTLFLIEMIIEKNTSLAHIITSSLAMKTTVSSLYSKGAVKKIHKREEVFTLTSTSWR